MRVPKGDTSGAAKAGIFNKNQLKYDKEKDEYIYPAGNVLPYRRNAMEVGLKIRIYVNHIACRDCAIRIKCTRSRKEPRKMRRWEHKKEIDAMRQRLKAASDTPPIRKQTVEHPFGTIKMWMEATHYLTKRLKNISTETNLHVLAYNLKRMMSIKDKTSYALLLRQYQ